MKIISYNIFEGVANGRDRLADFISGHAPDVLCLQEANGWDVDEQRVAKEFAQKVGMPNLVFGVSNTEYHLAVLSRKPFIKTEVHTKGIWHCAIHATVPYGDSELQLWNVHLDPRTEDNRVAEAKLLLSLMGTGQQTLAMGDFNSLSPDDDYPDDLLQQLLKQGVKKFGETELRFDVMKTFAAGGMIDTAHKLGTADSSVPTPANKDADHAAKLRLDYLLASQEALPLVKSVVVEKNEKTDNISDHYPLVITLG